MKLLLTSGGVSGPSIREALVDLLGKPIEQAHVLCIPTAEYGHPMCTPQSAWRFVSGSGGAAMTSLPWASIGLLELTALPTMDQARWQPWVRDADALLVDGGDALYLAHWLQSSGLNRLFSDLDDTVWVGVSAGSMVMTPRIGREFCQWEPPGRGDAGLALVDFSIFPHLDHPDMPSNTVTAAESWAMQLDGPAYALDDASAIVVRESQVQVVSDGRWIQLR